MDSERQLQIIAAKYKQQRKLYNEELKQAEASGNLWKKIVVYYSNIKKLLALQRERAAHSGLVEGIRLEREVCRLEKENEQLWARGKQIRSRKLKALALKAQQSKNNEIKASTKVDHVVEMVRELDINEHYPGNRSSKL